MIQNSRNNKKTPHCLFRAMMTSLALILFLLNTIPCRTDQTLTRSDAVPARLKPFINSHIIDPQSNTLLIDFHFSHEEQYEFFDVIALNQNPADTENFIASPQLLELLVQEKVHIEEECLENELCTQQKSLSIEKRLTIHPSLLSGDSDDPAIVLNFGDDFLYPYQLNPLSDQYVQPSLQIQVKLSWSSDSLTFTLKENSRTTNTYDIAAIARYRTTQEISQGDLI